MTKKPKAKEKGKEKGQGQNRHLRPNEEKDQAALSKSKQPGAKMEIPERKKEKDQIAPRPKLKAKPIFQIVKYTHFGPIAMPNPIWAPTNPKPN